MVESRKKGSPMLIVRRVRTWRRGKMVGENISVGRRCSAWGMMGMDLWKNKVRKSRKFAMSSSVWIMVWRSGESLVRR